jgi:hypothetical protein
MLTRAEEPGRVWRKLGSRAAGEAIPKLGDVPPTKDIRAKEGAEDGSHNSPPIRMQVLPLDAPVTQEEHQMEKPFRIIGICHVAVATSDKKKAQRIWREILGGEKRHTFTSPSENVE